MAENLIKKETLNYNDVEALIGPPPYGNKRLIEPADFEEFVRQEQPAQNASVSTEEKPERPPTQP